MAFKSLGLPTGNARNLPWLEEWIESLPKKERKVCDKQYYPVQKLSGSLKGISISTALFSVFVFKKTPLYDNLIEAMGVWGDTGKGKELLIFISDIYSAAWDIGIDSEVDMYWESQKLGKVLARVSEEPEEVESGSNPFLI